MTRSLAALALVPLVAADAAPLTVEGDRTFDAVVHGVPARIRIDPGAPSMPVINPDMAARASVNGGLLSPRASIGPVRLTGKSSVLSFDLAGSGPFDRRASWFDARWVEGADGTIGPGGMPAAIVRFQLRAAQPDERSVSLPLADFGWSGMGVRVDVGGQPLVVRFTPEREYSVATASAGALIAGAHRGAFDRPAESMPIRLEVVRPVRHMKLADPLTVGAIVLEGLMVRTADFGNAAGIPEGEQPEPDPDEIVVTGTKKMKKRELRLEIGRDALDRCSSITFDKRAKTVTLSCR